MHSRPVIPGRAQLVKCRAEQDMWRLMYLLRPFAQSQLLPPFQDQEQRRLWPRPRRARTAAEIPTQRPTPPGMQVAPRTEWGTRSNR